MGVTISTHNGSSVSREHNIRNKKVVSKEEHIDPQGHYEVWHDVKVRDAYEQLFGEATREYNMKQTRADRQIKSYYSEVAKDSKKHVCYEMLVAVGNRENPIDEALGKDILKKFVYGGSDRDKEPSWADRNPNLKLIGAYYHADEEGVPHIHVDYIPVADGYKNGLRVQNGLVKALGQMGFEKQGKATAQIQWEKRENQHLEALCTERGLEVEHPMVEGRTHLHTKVYKAEKKIEKAEMLQAEVADKVTQTNNLILEANTKAQNILDKAKKEREKMLAEAKQEEARLKEGAYKARKEVLELGSELIGIKAEYEAKKAYVEQMSKDFGLIGEGVQENKALFGGKVKSYTVSAEKWETQAVSLMDREAQKRADKVFEKHVTEFKNSTIMQNVEALSKRIGELERRNTSLDNENRSLRQQLNGADTKLNRVIDSLPATVAQAFIRAWENADKVKSKDNREIE